LNERSTEVLTKAPIVNPVNGMREGESFKTGSEDKRERMAAYVEWLLLPPSNREPKTKTALAEQLGVTYNTLNNYDREPYVQRELTERARASFKTVSLTEVLASLRDIATGRAYETTHGGEVRVVSASAAVSAAKTLLDWVERTDNVRTEDLNLKDLTDQQLMDVALQIFQQAGSLDNAE